jgi:hypothetical protein
MCWTAGLQCLSDTTKDMSLDIALKPPVSISQHSTPCPGPHQVLARSQRGPLPLGHSASISRTNELAPPSCSFLLVGVGLVFSTHHPLVQWRPTGSRHGSTGNGISQSRPPTGFRQTTSRISIARTKIETRFAVLTRCSTKYRQNARLYGIF